MSISVSEQKTAEEIAHPVYGMVNIGVALLENAAEDGEEDAQAQSRGCDGHDEIGTRLDENGTEILSPCCPQMGWGSVRTRCGGSLLRSWWRLATTEARKRMNGKGGEKTLQESVGGVGSTNHIGGEKRGDDADGDDDGI